MWVVGFPSIVRMTSKNTKQVKEVLVAHRVRLPPECHQDHRGALKGMGCGPPREHFTPPKLDPFKMAILIPVNPAAPHIWRTVLAVRFRYPVVSVCSPPSCEAYLLAY